MKKKINPFNIISIFCLFYSFILSTSVHAGYFDMPLSLPDDSGLYELNSTTARYICDGSISGNEQNCPPNDNGIVDDGGHHQYFTIANTDNLNNVRNGERIGGYRETRIVLYTKSPSLSNEISITPVNRGIRTDGGNTTCAGNLRMLLTKPGGSGIPVNNGDSESIKNFLPSSCNRPKAYGLSELLYNPSSYNSVFSPLTIKDINGNDHNTGIFYTYLTIILSGGSDSLQFSYRVGSSDGKMRLGLSKGAYINMYPTALARNHRMSFKWKTPCNVNTSAAVYSDNLDGNNQQIQSHIPQPYIQRYVNGSTYGSTISIVGRDNYSGNFPSRQGSVPVTNEIIYNNMSGGNGIGFTYPYNSNDFFLECPEYKWNLSPQSEVKGQASYDPNWADWRDSVVRATNTFRSFDFTHLVKENNGVSAPNQQHYWDVEIKTIRGDTGIESSVQRLNNNYTGTVGENSSLEFTNTNKMSPYYTVFKNLIGNNNWLPNNANSNCSSNPRLAATRSCRTPRPNDQYCERLVISLNGSTQNYNTTTGSISSPSAGWKCASLVPGGICYAIPWAVVSTSNFDQTEGRGSPSNAWVDDVYKFNAAAWNNGPAVSTTSPIHFWINRGDRGEQVLGRWDSGDDWLRISRGDAGKTFEKIFEYSPANGDASCGVSGSGQQGPYNVFVPYYYHLPTEMKPTPSLKDKIDQGSSINVAGKITLPEKDSDVSPRAAGDRNDGRKHTYTENDREHQWRLLSFVVDDKTQAQNAFGTGARDSSAPCNTGNGIATFGMAGARDCNVIKSGQKRFDSIGTFDINGDFQVSPTTPVGTIICFTVAVEKPRDDLGWDTWRYAPPICTTVIKSPKVQFKYGDVNTGRPRIGVGSCQANPNARIETTGAPNVALVEPNPLERHKYGSWGEYGVFSSGSIIAFGSSGAEAGTTDKAKRLTFGNDTSGYGAYAHNIKCIPNLMNGFSAQDTISSNTIYPNEYFKEAGRDTKSRFQKTGDINLAQRPVDKYKVKVSIVGSGDWGNDIPLNQGGELSPPKIKVRLDLKDSSISRTKTVDVPSQDRNNTTPTEIWFDENELSTDGWKGVGNVSVKFDNNNANWYWDNMRPQMRDRNLYISTMQVQWYKNEVEIANTGAKLATQLNKVDGIDYIRDDPVRCTQREGNPASWQWWENNVSFDEKILAFPPSESDARIGRGGGSCFGIHMDANTLAGYDGRFNQQYPPSPVLSSEYDGFNGRNIILYAQKKQAGDCGAGGVEGNLYINLDILYKISGYNNLSQIPRFTLMADCNIIIADNVQNVRASLIAGNAIQTCSNIAKSQNVCNKPLTITGAIQAKKLLLYRTSGADLTSAGDAKHRLKASNTV